MRASNSYKNVHRAGRRATRYASAAVDGRSASRHSHSSGPNRNRRNHRGASHLLVASERIVSPDLEKAPPR